MLMRPESSGGKRHPCPCCELVGFEESMVRRSGSLSSNALQAAGRQLGHCGNDLARVAGFSENGDYELLETAYHDRSQGFTMRKAVKLHGLDRLVDRHEGAMRKDSAGGDGQEAVDAQCGAFQSQSEER
jgi:hypothetical protein